MSPPQYYTPIAFSHDINSYGLALHAYKYDIVFHDQVRRPYPALMCLIRHLGMLSGQGPHITFEDWVHATPPPTWKDNYNEVDLLCLIVQQINNKLELSKLFSNSNETYIAYAYVSSLLWRGVQLQLLSLSKPIDIKLVGADIAYWSCQLKRIIVELEIQRNGRVFNIKIRMQLHALTTALDVLKEDQRALQQLVQVNAMPISSPSPTPTTHKRGEESKSMSVVSAPSQSATPLALLSQLHSTQARTGAVPTQSVSMQHTAKQPPQDDSPRRREKSSYSPTQSTQKRGGGIQAKTHLTSRTIQEVDKAVHIQRLWRSLKQRIRVRISHRKQQSRVLHAVLVLQHHVRSLLLRKQCKRYLHTKQLLLQTSKYSQQVKAKQTQSNRGGNRRPPPIPFETPIGSNDSDRKFLQHPFRDRGMPLPSRKKTRRGKRKNRTCRTGRRHTPNAPDPILDCGGDPWCISDDTTDKSIKYTDFDEASTDPVCMPLVYWSTQTTAMINLLRPEQSTNTLYLPYISTANDAATIIQHAYTKHINHFMPHHHHHVTTNAPTQLNNIMRATITDYNTQFDTQFDNIIAKLESIIQRAAVHATDNIVGDNRLLDDNG